MATVGQLLATDSYRYLSVSMGSLLIMTIPIFNAIVGLLFFHKPFTLPMACGALIILASSTGLILDKRQNKSR